MGVRCFIITILVFFTALFAAQTAFAHPQKVHNDKAQEQVQSVDKSGETTEHNQESGGHDKATTDHHDDAGTAPHEHGNKPVADHHASGSENPEHGHEEGNQEAGGGHDEAGGEAGGHSHWGISPDSTPFSKIMASFGKFHPLVVHFPIALFLTAAFAQVLNMRSKDGSYDKAVTLLVWLGALGALGAGLLGWAHSGPMQAGENTVMSAHRWIGTSLLIGGLMTAYLMTKARKTEGGLIGHKAFNLFLFSMALGVAINGFLGGSLAHGGIKHLMPMMM